MLEAVDAVVDSQSINGNVHSARASPRSPRASQGIIGSLLTGKTKNNNPNNIDDIQGIDYNGSASHRGRTPSQAQMELAREELNERDLYNPRNTSSPRADTSRLPALPLHTPSNENNNNHNDDNNYNNADNVFNNVLNSNNISPVGNTINRSIHNAIVNNTGHPNRGNGSRGNGSAPRGLTQSPSSELRATIGEKVHPLEK